MAASSASADEVAADLDLLTEILIRLPIRSLMRFKCVSKHWLSLITGDSFSLLRNPTSTPVSGLFVQPYSTATATIQKLDFIPLTNTTTTPTNKPAPHFNGISFFPGLPGNIEIISSCHGLLLGRLYSEQEQENHESEYVVLNPTTKRFKFLPDCHLSDLTSPTITFDPTIKKFKALPHCHISDLIGLTLAFDPSRSPHYKIVCFRYTLLDSTIAAGRYCQIVTYSSETGSWKASSEPFTAAYNNYSTGVYWNGAVHCLSRWGIGDSHYFNISEERIGITPVPPAQEREQEREQQQERGIIFCCRLTSSRYSLHIEESGGHLHLVRNYDYGLMNRVDVYEMARDYSMWLSKYRVDDLNAIGIPRNPQGRSSISVLRVVRTERDEESFMVLHIPGKIFCYGFADGNVKEICDLAAMEGFDNERMYFPSNCHLYMESLSRV